jgi:hypothetical protein
MVAGSLAVRNRQLPGSAACGVGHTRIVARHAALIAIAVPFAVCRLSRSAAIWEKKLDGILSIVRPRRSRTWESAMIAAIPVVKPITIATG